LPVEVVAVVRQRRRAEVHHHLGLGVVARAVDGDQPVGLDVDQAGVVQVQHVGRGEDHGVQPEVLDVRLLRPERQRAHPRVLTVGAHDEVEGTGLAALERHVHAVGVVGDRGDRVTEDVFGVVPGRLVEDAREVAAKHLDVAPGLLGRHPDESAAPSVHLPPVSGTGTQAFDRLEQSHPTQHVQVDGTAEVDGVATVADRRRAFDDRRGEAVPPKPVRQGRAGDASARDEDGFR
jgi:hypothetical protein